MDTRRILKSALSTTVVPWLLVATGCGYTSGGRNTDSSSGVVVETNFAKPAGSSSYLIAKIEGAPVLYSNASSLSIAITRQNEASSVKFKVAMAGERECYRDYNWSDYSEAATITLDTSKLVDGEAVLCLFAKTLGGDVDSNPVIVQWLQDLTPPKPPATARMISPDVSITNKSLTRNITLGWIPSEDVDPDNGAPASLLKAQLVLVGTTPGTRDIFVKSYGLTDYRANITVPQDGDFYFSIAAVDNAGNETITKIASLISIDESAPPAPTNVTWSPVSPTTQTTGIVASWSAVNEATAVTYQYKLGSASGLSDLGNLTAVSTNRASLALTDGKYYISIKAINSVALESAWFNSNTPFVVDTIKPLIGLTNNPNGLTIHRDYPDIRIASPSQDDVYEFMYKLITGTNCSLTGVWSNWFSAASTTIADNINGPAYETTMSLCMKARDAAGNESAPNSDASVGYRISSWTNVVGTRDFGDLVKAKISFKTSDGIRDLTSVSGAWTVPDPASSTPAWSTTSSRTRTSANGTTYVAVDSLVNSVRETTVTRTPTTGSSTSTDLSAITVSLEESGRWCSGDLYLLDLAINPQAVTESADEFHALVSCITGTGSSASQRIQVISYNNEIWSRQPITTLPTQTKAIGAIAKNSPILVAISDPSNQTNQNLVSTCINPTNSSVSGDCSTQGKLIAINGSAGTTGLAALIPTADTSRMRVAIAGPMSGTMRLGIASGTTVGSLTLKWMATELALPENFSMHPYLIELP